MSELNFGSLQDLLVDWPNAVIPEVGHDGVYDRILQVLKLQKMASAAPIEGDLMSLLRHVLRRQSLQSGTPARLRVLRSEGWPSREQWSKFGVVAQEIVQKFYLLEALPWSPDWMAEQDTPVFEMAFAECKVRIDRQCPIDPFLQEAADFESYTSPGQREAVRSAFLLPPGHTLIVGLPTGSGKSFVAQAPILVRGIEGPTSICVVPTTALALDQARQTGDMLKRRFPRASIPILAWHAGLNAAERESVKKAIRSGTQGILYCSPEGVTGALLPSLYDAAQAGLLSYLVIDEAHLLSQWGDGFRPDFQMLAGVRRGLLQHATEHPFRTVLMSATLSSETIATFDTLFGPVETVQMCASIHLRPEPQFWIDHATNPDEKFQHVLEAVHLAPRPVILYVTKRDDAKAWLRTLRQAGFSRSRCFHGDTPDDERRQTIQMWADNELDIVVATSAFGVGIDKRDVRAVIHATVPETLDRFYQEVGRGGRDGKTSGSLLIYSDRDVDLANSIAAPSLISDELGFSRWEAMATTAVKLDEFGFLLQLDLGSVPAHGRMQTDYNLAWNVRTLIMMARAGMIQIESTPPEILLQDENETEADFKERANEEWTAYYKQAVIRLLETGVRNPSVFEEMIGMERARAAELANRGQKLRDALLGGLEEIADLLHELYSNTSPGRLVFVSRACGGCPSGRRLDADSVSYSAPAALGIRQVDSVDFSRFLQVFRQLNVKEPIIVALPEVCRDAHLEEALTVLVSRFGIREVGISDSLRKLDCIGSLHQNFPGKVLLIQSLEEELRSGVSSYQLPRVSIVDEKDAVDTLFMLDRPLHIILAKPVVPDPFHPSRRLVETGRNILSWDQFKAGSSL